MSGVIRHETQVFLLSVLHGIGLTLCYDLLRALRRAFAHTTAAVSAEDFLFWLAAGFLTFCLAFFHTDGVIRGYVAAGIAIGVILYHFTFRTPVVRGISWFLLSIKRAVSAVFRVVSRPVKKICHFWKKIIEIGEKNRYNHFKKKLRGIRYGRKAEKTKQQQQSGDGCDRGDCADAAGRSARAEPGAQGEEQAV